MIFIGLKTTIPNFYVFLQGTRTSIGNASIIAKHRNNDINTTRCNFQSPNEFLRQSVELPLDDTQT